MCVARIPQSHTRTHVFITQDEYNEISSKAEEFAVSFLGLCRTAGEVQVVLSRHAGVEKTNTKGVRVIFPRLQVAQHYGQKEVRWAERSGAGWGRVGWEGAGWGGAGWGDAVLVHAAFRW